MRIFVHEARTEMGLSIRQLSNLTGIPKSTLYDLEDERFMPRLDDLIAIMQALHCTFEDLVSVE